MLMPDWERPTMCAASHLRGSPMVARAAAAAYDVSLARRLWALSAQLTSTDQGGLT
jgi:hypothetical protein